MLNVINESSTRIKTGIVLFIAIFIIGYIDSYFVFWLVFGIMLLISISEAKKLFGIKNDIIFVYTTLLWIAAYFYPKPEDLIFIVAIAYASQLAYKKTLNTNVFLPLLYPTASFLFLLSLYSEYGTMTLLWLLVIVASTDIGAYFVGRLWGKNKLCPSLSPQKTVEGAIAGFIGAVCASIAIHKLAVYMQAEWFHLSFSEAVWLGMLIGILGQIGDLAESLLKRDAAVKDSNALPGLGGVLDMVDSLLFTTPIVYFFLRMH